MFDFLINIVIDLSKVMLWIREHSVGLLSLASIVLVVFMAYFLDSLLAERRRSEQTMRQLRRERLANADLEARLESALKAEILLRKELVDSLSNAPKDLHLN